MNTDQSFHTPKEFSLQINNISEYKDIILEYIKKNWKHVALDAADKSLPIGFEKSKKNTLIIVTNHSAWSNEINWKKEELLIKINNLLNWVNFSVENLSYKVDHNWQKIEDESQSIKKNPNIDSHLLEKNINDSILTELDKLQDNTLKRTLLEIAKRLK